MDITKAPIQEVELKFSETLDLNKEMIEKGIYSRLKLISQSITGTGNYYIKNGFPPKLVQASTQEANKKCDGATDFTTTYSIRVFDNTGLATSESADLINTGSMTANITKRYFDGFNLNVTSYSGSPKNIYFICYS